MSSYQPNIPTGTVNLDVDYQNIQGNFQQLDTSFGVDHVPFSVNSVSLPAGYHKVVHMVPNTGAATPVAGFGEVYVQSLNDLIATDTELFYQTGGGRNIQMTRNFVPVAAANGYTFLPGGLILQWGIASIAASTTTALLFATANINFPTSCFMVQVTGIRNNSGGDGVFVLSGSVSTTGFTFRNGSGSITQAYWMAIGI